jgi:hypothetical protein
VEEFLEKHDVTPDFEVDDLVEAVDWILQDIQES